LKSPLLRNEAIKRSLDLALTSTDRRLFVLLSQHGNLPGPRPNDALAEAIGDELVARGQVSDPLIHEMISLDERQAPGTSSQAFLLVVGAHALVSRIQAGFDERSSFEALEELAGDPRKAVRDGVVSALERLAIHRKGDAGELLARLGPWTGGFLQAAVVLETFARRPVLDQLHEGEGLVGFFDAAADLVENASRAEERTQGRRRLLEVIEQSLPPAAMRFPAVMSWFERRGSSQQPELRQALEHAIDRLRKLGADDAALDPIRHAIDASAPPLRDPTHYKGPTRGRGRKAERRGVRR
jgi:hypothetical protein